MSNLFVADPAILNQEGNKIVDQGGMFDQNVKTIYSTLDEMLGSYYLSPAAMELGQKIRTYRDDLDKMTAIIREYGTFLVGAGRKVNKNEQNIIDAFKN